MEKKYTWKPDGRELYALYVEQRLSLRDLEKRTGASSPTLRNWLAKAGVKTRSISEAALPANRLLPADSVDCPIILGLAGSATFRHEGLGSMEESTRCRLQPQIR